MAHSGPTAYGRSRPAACHIRPPTDGSPLGVRPISSPIQAWSPSSWSLSVLIVLARLDKVQAGVCPHLHWWPVMVPQRHTARLSRTAHTTACSTLDHHIVHIAGSEKDSDRALRD